MKVKGGVDVAEWLRSAALSTRDLHLGPLSVHGGRAEWGFSLSLINFWPRRISSLCKHVDLGSPFSDVLRLGKGGDNLFRWADTGLHIHPRLSCNGKSLINSNRANAVVVSFGEVALNGSILRNQVNASCAAGTSFTPNPKYNLCCFLQVSIVTQSQAVSGHAAEHLSKTAQAVAGYYLWCLVIEPHCWCLLRAPACIFISYAHLPPFHQTLLASGCDRCSQNVAALTTMLLEVFFFNTSIK